VAIATPARIATPPIKKKALGVSFTQTTAMAVDSGRTGSGAGRRLLAQPDQAGEPGPLP